MNLGEKLYKERIERRNQPTKPKEKKLKKIKLIKEVKNNEIDIMTLENRCKFLTESCPEKPGQLKDRYKIEISAIKAGIRALKAEMRVSK